MIALIPARKNSKRFPRKNHASFHGVSLLERTVVCAEDSGLFSEIYLSTDDEELAQKAQKLGVNVPHMRPDYLALDDTSSWDVVRDFLGRIRYQGNLALLQLTSPLREALDLTELATKFNESDSTYGLTVSPQEYRVDADSWLCSHSYIISSAPHCTNSIRVGPNGSCYMVSSAEIQSPKDPKISGAVGQMVPTQRSLDIDYRSQLSSG